MIGIDGCKAGWCMIRGQKDAPQLELIDDINRLDLIRGVDEVVCIDIPIGLPDQCNERTIESKARKLLSSKASSFFGVPCRQAVYAQSYEEANDLNKRETGKGLSIQSWHISKKIKEVDSWLLDQDDHRHLIKEAHPELCFHFLHSPDERLASKKTPQGRMQRLDILSHWVASSDQIYHEAMDHYLRRDVAADDILDALCLWCVAMLSERYALKGVATPEVDREGLVMNMYFVDPYNKYLSHTSDIQNNIHK